LANKKTFVIKQIFCIPFLFIFSASFSQSISSNLSKAKNHVLRGEYYLAADNYLAILKEDSLNKKANLEYGLLNTQYINNPGKAGVYLLRAERLSTKDTLPELLLGLAQYYHHVGRYLKALIYYKRMFAKFEKKSESIQIENIIKQNIASCEYALSNPVQPLYKRMKTVNAGDGVNTMYPEYSPVVNKGGTVLLFTTRRETNVGHKIDDVDGNYFEDMYLARKDKDNNFKNAHSFSDADPEVNGLRNTKGHEAVVSLSADGNKFFTYHNNKLYQSDWQNNSWTAPQLMSTAINSIGGFQSHLSMGSDGKTIYFSSERPGGLGGLDIYKSEMQADGNWGTAVNLGSTVNTKEDDDSPFISYDGLTLYFASKGYPGYGAYDIYKSVLTGTAWGKPENMGTMFNSSGDDTHFAFNKTETGGVFSSARAGGFGDMDIYEIKYEDPFEHFTNDSLNRISISPPDTFYVNETASFGVYSAKLPPSAFKRYYWEVADSLLSVEGETVNYTFTKTGKHRIRVQGLTTDNDLIGYEKNVVVTNRTSTTVAANSTTTTATTNNTNISSLEPIYFKFNKYGITEESKEALMRNLKILVNKPEAVITISAYCDARGSSAYNQLLSEKRAKATARYLKKLGFSENRIKQIDWFGEKDPLNKCIDGTPCTAGEYKINRRVEFKVIIK